MDERSHDDVARALAAMSQAPAPVPHPEGGPPLRPQTPHPAQQEPWPQEHGTDEHDDDTVIVPPPDLAAFRPRAARRRRRQHEPAYRTLRFRRTLIPVLFTCGVLLPAIAIWSVVDGNAVLSQANPTLALVLSGTGLLLLAAWVLNVLHVRHELRSQMRPPG